MLLALALALLAQPSPAATSQEQLVAKLKPTIVNVYVYTSAGLAGDLPGNTAATAFVVDAARGWIATNRHVCGISPATFKVTFYDGEVTNAVHLLYYDPWHDLAILRVDTAAVQIPLRETPRGDTKELQEQEKIILIGNNDGSNYTVLYGEIINTSRNPEVSPDVPGDNHRHSSSFQYVLNSRGGSSGSPVVDPQGRVIGINHSGNDVTGDALRVEYLEDTLRCLRSGRPSCRGDVGVVLDLMPIADARRHLHLPDETIERIRAAAGGTELKNLIYVKKLISGSPAEKVLQPGDVVVSAAGRVLGAALYDFDKAVDERLGGAIDVGVMRNGRPLSARLKVEDAEAGKIRRFATVGGGTFHEITPEVKRRFGVEGPGVVLSQTTIGSSLDVGSRYDKTPMFRQVVFQAINGVPTPDLDSFAREVSKLKSGVPFYATARDFVSTDGSSKIMLLELDLKFYPLRLYRLSPESLEWEEEPAAPGADKAR